MESLEDLGIGIFHQSGYRNFHVRHLCYSELFCVVEDWEIDVVLYQRLTGASWEYLPYLWLDHDTTASGKNTPSWPTETVLSKQHSTLNKEHVQSSKIFCFAQCGIELHLSILWFEKRQCCTTLLLEEGFCLWNPKRTLQFCGPAMHICQWLLLMLIRLESCREEWTP